MSAGQIDFETFGVLNFAYVAVQELEKLQKNVLGEVQEKVRHLGVRFEYLFMTFSIAFWSLLWHKLSKCIIQAVGLLATAAATLEQAACVSPRSLI